MKRLISINLFFLISIFLIFSCERIPTSDKGELTSLNLSNLKGVPSEYGSLISVTVPRVQSGWPHLWFHDEEHQQDG